MPDSKHVPEVGEVYKGKVRSIMPYGAFIEFLPGKDGLLHISEIDWKRLETVEEAGIVIVSMRGACSFRSARGSAIVSVILPRMCIRPSFA